jgi:hypothetical protein
MTDKPPTGIQLRRVRGWRMPRSCVKVDRSSKVFGNPFRVGVHGDAGTCVAKFEVCLAVARADLWSLLPAKVRVETDRLVHQGVPVRTYFETMASRLSELRGKDLGCWCPLAAPCHRSVLLRYVNPAAGE